MTPLWSVHDDLLEIREMPFYWRLSASSEGFPGIPGRLGIRVHRNAAFDYLEYAPSGPEWQAIDTAYRQNENIGFVNPESGQMDTYGASCNRFFHEVIEAHAPKRIYEIGCGAGFSIRFLAAQGWQVTGIDPSEYSDAWSKRLGFPLINAFFDGELLAGDADLIYCNDVFEHVRQVETFSRDVFRALKPGGIFCFATTNSTQAIALGDISMLEHQHVNMFTERSLYLILAAAGFSEITVGGGSYGNTFHVVAVKSPGTFAGDLPPASCANYFGRAAGRITAFTRFYERVGGHCQFYVPLRCIPYLATVGDFGASDLFDSNIAWRGKYVDGYSRPIKSKDDLMPAPDRHFFIGSLTFRQEIAAMLGDRGFDGANLESIETLTVT